MIEAYLQEKVAAEAPALGGRFFPVVLPQECPMPAGTYRVSGGSPIQILAGVSRTRHKTFELVAVASDYLSAKLAHEEIIAALAGTRGFWGSSPPLWIQGVDMIEDSEEDGYEPDRKLFTVSSSYTIQWAE